MFSFPLFSPRPTLHSLRFLPLTELLFLGAGILMLAITVMENRLIPQASITQNDLMVAKVNAQKIVLAQDSLFNVDTLQYKP